MRSLGESVQIIRSARQFHPAGNGDTIHDVSFDEIDTSCCQRIWRWLWSGCARASRFASLLAVLLQVGLLFWISIYIVINVVREIFNCFLCLLAGTVAGGGELMFASHSRLKHMLRSNVNLVHLSDLTSYLPMLLKKHMLTDPIIF